MKSVLVKDEMSRKKVTQIFLNFSSSVLRYNIMKLKSLFFLFKALISGTSGSNSRYQQLERSMNEKCYVDEVSRVSQSKNNILQIKWGKERYHYGQSFIHVSFLYCEPFSLSVRYVHFFNFLLYLKAKYKGPNTFRPINHLTHNSRT